MRAEDKPIQGFEDLVAWQKAKDLSKAIYLATGDGKFAQDRDLTRQIRRAAVSVMSNLAEGYERHTTKDYHAFVSTAKVSCAEVRSHLYLAQEIGYLTEANFARLMNQATEVNRLVGGLRQALATRLNTTSRPSALGPRPSGELDA